MRTFTILTTILILAFLTASCSPAEEVNLTAADNGSSIEIKKGSTFKVTLEGNPTTGYIWEADNLDSTLLKQAGESEFDQDSDLVGSGGAETLSFEAVGSGQTNLKLVYHRPWEEGEDPVDTFEISISIP